MITFKYVVLHPTKSIPKDKNLPWYSPLYLAKYSPYANLHCWSKLKFMRKSSGGIISTPFPVDFKQSDLFELRNVSIRMIRHTGIS